jgi:arabinose-5-phosphate isomerase
MTPKPKTVPPEMLAAEALTVMNARPPKVTHLFVVDPKADIPRPLGFISVHDILRAGLS